MKQNKHFDPFILRAIEYWLDNANELTYQPIFCFWLTTQGYSVKYLIKSTIFEQGKDVVAVNKANKACAFQLKGGNINISRWRTEVKPEIEVLIDLPIKHPEIDNKANHLSFLVTNGFIEDAVRIEILDYNNSKWKKSKLHILDRGDLLNAFQNISHGILPPNAESYKQLMDLLFIDTSGLPDVSKVYKFLDNTIEIQNKKDNKAQIKRSIAACVFYCNLIVSGYRLSKNYVAIVNIMTVLCAKILNIACRTKLPELYWKASFRLVLKDIIDSAKLLDTYFLTSDLNNTINSLFDNQIIPFRKHAAVSVLYSLKLSEILLNDPNSESIFHSTNSKHYLSNGLIISESSFVNSINLALIFSTKKSVSYASIDILSKSLDQLIDSNGRNSKEKGLRSPYYSLTEIVENLFGIKEINNKESYKNRSYFLGSLIDLLVRLDAKDILISKWKDLSFFRVEEFICETESDYFTWRTKKGVNRTTIMPKSTTWSQLKEETFSLKETDLPKYLKDFPEFIPFFTLVFPHRVTKELVGYLFSTLGKLNSNYDPEKS